MLHNVFTRELGDGPCGSESQRWQMLRASYFRYVLNVLFCLNGDLCHPPITSLGWTNGDFCHHRNPGPLCRKVTVGVLDTIRMWCTYCRAWHGWLFSLFVLFPHVFYLPYRFSYAGSRAGVAGGRRTMANRVVFVTAVLSALGGHKQIAHWGAPRCHRLT